MKFTIRYKEMDKPLGIEDFIAKKLVKLEKFEWVDDEVKIELRLYSKEKQFKASLIVSPQHTNTIQAEATSNNLNSAFDSALEKIITQLIKIKETRTNH